MSKKFLFLISFVLLVGLAASAAADELIASYEDNEYPGLLISTHTKDPTLTVTRMLGGTSGAPSATNGDYILKWVWTNETDRKIEIEQSWATRRFNLSPPYNVITADVWFDVSSALPATIGIWSYHDVNDANWPVGVFFAPAIVVPTVIQQWHTVTMDLTGKYPGLGGTRPGPNDVNNLFAFLFESLAGNSGVIYTDNMWLRSVGQVQAWRPIPFNKAVSMDPNVDLSWEPGIDANLHDVYFGTDFNDVNNASRANHSQPGLLHYDPNQPLADVNYDPGTLKRLTTYYWRIDEVSSGGPPIYKGDVWRFKTAPVKYVEIPLTSYEDSDTRYGVWQGITITGDADLSLTLGDKLKGGSSSPTWANGVNVPPASDGSNVLGLWWNNEADLEVEHGCTFAGSDFTFDLDGSDEMVFDVYYDYNNAAGGFNPLPHDIQVFDWRFVPAHAPSSNLPTTRGEWHTIVIDVSHLKNIGLDSIYDFLFALHGPDKDFDPNRADPNNWGALMYMDNLRLRSYVAESACGPAPVNRATDVPRQLTLTWEPGVYAADVNGHELYFSSDFNDVNGRTGTATEIVRDANNYPIPSPLNLGQTYYWRVDEVNNAGPDPCFWPGDVWSFTVANYLVVEDFNSYANDDALWVVWKDYRSQPIPKSRAEIWLETDPNYKTDGNSMKYQYTNSNSPYYAEAYADIATLPSNIGSDWTANGVKALTLYFYGQAGNDANEKMYVKLTDSNATPQSKTVNYPLSDMNDIREPSWHEWNIALTAFTPDVNLKKVKWITIGFGDRDEGVGPDGGDGAVYFEDIRLYIPRCIPSTVPDSASGNCFIDYPDLQILTNNWLISEYPVEPNAPSEANLVAYYKFDGDFNDYSPGHKNNGEPNGATIVTDPARGQVASFDVNYYVDCGNDASLNEPNITGKITLAAWVKTNDCGNRQFNPYITKGDHAYTLQHRAPPNTNVNELEIAIYDAGTTWYFASTPVDSSFNGVWHHLAGTYNGSQIKLYVDGELKDTNDYVGSIPSETNNVNLGTSSDFTDRWYEGLLDDVRIYSRALSQEEVASLAERSTFTQPLEPLLTPQNPGINLFDDGKINFKDYAVLADEWLEEVLWP